MVICKCKSEPDRNDAYAKDGYSALCETHKHQVGKYPRTEKLEEVDIGGKTDVKSED